MRLAIATTMLLLLGACSSLLPKLESPQLTVVGIELVKADLLQQQLRVRMHVHNPNDRELSVRGIDYTVELAGDEFAHGDSERNFTVPALGDSEFDVNVFANAAPMLLKFATGARTDAVDYRIVGKVRLAGGLIRSVPFTQKGSFKLR